MGKPREETKRNSPRSGNGFVSGDHTLIVKSCVDFDLEPSADLVKVIFPSSLSSRAV